MNLNEIVSYLISGSSRSVCIDRRLMPEFPGYVRSITIHSQTRVVIEFELHNTDEGGAYFWGEFSDLSHAVRSLEEYLGSPISEWTNHTKTGTYPDLPGSVDIALGHEALASAISLSSLALPKDGNFTLQSDTYWSHFEKP